MANFEKSTTLDRSDIDFMSIVYRLQLQTSKSTIDIFLMHNLPI